MNDYDDSEDCSSNNAFRARSNTWPLNRPDIIVPGGICIDEALPEIELEDDDLFTTNENWSSGFDHDIMSWDPLLNAQNQHASTNNITGQPPHNHQPQQQQQQHHHHHNHHQQQQSQTQPQQPHEHPQHQTQTQQLAQHTPPEQAQHHLHHAPYHLQEASSSAPGHLQQHSHHQQQPQQHQAQTHQQQLQQPHHPHHESYHPQQAAAATQQLQHLTLSEHFHHQHLQHQPQQHLSSAQQLAQDENFGLSEPQQVENHFALQAPSQRLANHHHHHQSQHSLHLSHQPHHHQHHLVGSPVLGDGLADVKQELVELEPPDSLSSATTTEALVHSLQQNDDINIGNKQSNSNAGSKTKLNTPRRNAWGNMSYADLISQAINSTNDKRLTLSQIYDWMVQHVPYFKDKGDSNSSAGWKNSVRHNLSLHNRFKRLQNEGTGKSSWWTINPEANVGKCARRRAASMEASKYEKKRGRAKKRAEAVRQGLAAYPSLTNSSLNGSTSALDQPLPDHFDAQTQQQPTQPQQQSHQQQQSPQSQTQQQPTRPRSSQAHRHNQDAEGTSSSNIHNGQPGLYITSRSDSQYESTDNMMQQQQQPPYFMPFTMNV